MFWKPLYFLICSVSLYLKKYFTAYIERLAPKEIFAVQYTKSLTNGCSVSEQNLKTRFLNILTLLNARVPCKYRLVFASTRPFTPSG